MAPRISNPQRPSSETADGRAAFGPRPILCAVLDGAGFGADPYRRARELFEAGVDWIQLRDRTLEDRSLWQIGCALVAARDESGPADESSAGRRVILNRRFDLARALGADGVHLGFDALAPETARSFLGSRALLGASLHSLAEVKNAAQDGVDYAHLAPIWDPLSKDATRPALGLDRFAEACRLGLPLLAQGGVDVERAREAIRAGATGVAVTGILASARSLGDAIRPLRESLDDGRRSAIG